MKSSIPKTQISEQAADILKIFQSLIGNAYSSDVFSAYQLQLSTNVILFWGIFILKEKSYETMINTDHHCYCLLLLDNDQH